MGAYSGLTGSPFKSGQVDREQGLSKAGNARLRRTLIELAWSWLQFQPTSQLSLWFKSRLGPNPDKRRKKVLIAAPARKLLVALWRFETQGVVPEGALPTDRAALITSSTRGPISPVDPGGRTGTPLGLISRDGDGSRPPEPCPTNAG